MRDRQIAQMDVSGTGVFDHDRRRAGCIVIHFAQSRIQLIDACRRCRPFGQANEIVGKPIERGQHRRKRGGDLHNRTQGHFTGQILGRGEKYGEYRRKECVAIEEPSEMAMLADDSDPALGNGAKRFLQPVALIAGPVDKRNTLGVLSNAR